MERVGLFRTVLTSIECLTTQSRLATADLIIIRYNLLDLWQGRVTAVQIVGLRLEAERQKDGSLLLAGWPEKIRSPRSGNDDQSPWPAAGLLLPPVKSLTIQGEVALRHPGAGVTPVAIRLSLAIRRPNKAYATLKVAAGQSKLNIHGKLADDRLRLWGDARLTALDAASWLATLPFRPAGHLTVSGFAKLAWPSATLLQARLACDSRNLRLRFPAGVSISSGGQGTIRFAAGAPAVGQWQDLVLAGAVSGRLHTLRVAVPPRSSTTRITARAELEINALQAAGQQIAMTGGRFLVRAAGGFPPSKAWEIKLTQKTQQPLRLRTESGQLSLGRPKGRCQAQASGAWACLANCNAMQLRRQSREILVEAPLELRVEGKSWRLPPSWRATLAGNFTATLPPLKRLTGRLELSAHAQPVGGAAFSLAASNLSLAGLAFSLQGKFSNGRLDLSGVIPELSFTDLPLTSILATADTAGAGLLSGRISGVFRARGPLQAPQATATLRLADGRVSIPGRGLTIEGIEGEVPFQAGSSFLSQPAEVRFGQARMGRYQVGPGRIKFQVVRPLEVIIDRAEGAWAGGVVRVAGLRLRPEMQELDIVLTCDRVRLAELLRQFGIDNVTGQGTVNGQVPLAYRAKRLTFGKGFLYSTPGEGGVVRMANINDLLAGSAQVGSPRFMQLDFAQAVLQRFRYEWARVTLTDDDGDVRLALELLGRPEEPVPFRYDERLGVFRRLKTKGAVGIDRPIRLDVNFRIPFNELLGYGTTIQKALDLAR